MVKSKNPYAPPKEKCELYDDREYPGSIINSSTEWAVIWIIFIGIMIFMSIITLLDQLL